jgi:hypothetical protein
MPRAALAVALVLLAGCGEKPPPAATFKSEPGHGHSHDHGKMLRVDLGKKHHAGLTAHLSQKDGNELDLVFETVAGKPAPMPLTNVVAKAKRAGDAKDYDLVFEPAPKDERKDDPDGTCSRFTAKAPWMKADDTLTVTATVVVDGKPHPVEWADFHPKKYAHVDE